MWAAGRGLGPEALASTSNCSLKCNCKAGLESFTERSKCAALKYSENDSSGSEVRRYCESLFSSVAGDQLAKSSINCTTDTLLAALKASNCTGPCICCQEQKAGLDTNVTATCRPNLPNAALHRAKGQRICPKYWYELKTREPTQEISLDFTDSSINDVYSHTMLKKSSLDSEAVLAVEVETYSKDLGAFSESINESVLQEDYTSGRQNQDDNKIQEINKDSKRKAREMERKVVAVEIESARNVDLEARIVRVSRLTGGKDRHSKVRTAKGLRDRRVRLSVSTAIQFYDLQDRLGLEQPSKAVDWLINAAKSYINELPELDAEIPSASAGNMTELYSSNSSQLMPSVVSPRESATAAAASALRAFGFGLNSPRAQGTNSHKATDGKDISLPTLKESDLGRSNSSTSEGSVKGSAEYTSNCSMSKQDPKIQRRFKARERARKKTASAKNSSASLPDIQQLNSIHPSLSSISKIALPYASLPLEYQTFSKNDNACGIQPQVLTGRSSAQQFWDYNAPSYTEFLCSQDSHPLQIMASSSTTALQNHFPPVPSTSSVPAVLGSSCFQTYEMSGSANQIFEPNQILHLEGNPGQTQVNLLYSNIPMLMKSVEQQQAETTVISRFSDDINFSTSGLSSRGPLQSNSSSITNMLCISHSRKNADGEGSLKATDFVPFQGCDSHTLFPAIHSAGQRKG